MDGRLKRDRETIIEEWGDLPPEARLYLLSMAGMRKIDIAIEKVHNMKRKTKAMVIGGTLITGVWALWVSIAVLEMNPWLISLMVGVLIGMIIGVVIRT